MPGTLVIIGRPNVGKSTLFNRLAGRRLALVDDQPGVTRDRREADGSLADLEFTIVDTAGLEDSFDDSLTGRMRRQTERALEDASVVLMLVDARAGILPLDSEFADWVRRLSIPVVLAANKCEGRQGEQSYLDAFELGLGEPIKLSAEHGQGLSDLYDALEPHLGARELVSDDDFHAAGLEEVQVGVDIDPDDDGSPVPDEYGPLRLAIVGRPNVGKSTLINALLKDERLLTGPEPGITRDAITIRWSYNDRDIALIDTAGLRRKARIDDKVEKLSVTDTLKAVRFAHVAVLVLDAQDMLEKQDLAIARHVVEEGRALVIAVNKWDSIRDKSAAMQKLADRIETSLPQIKGIKVVTLSAQTGQRLETLMPTVVEAYDLWNKRIGTSALNDWLAAETERHPPPLSGQKRRIKIRYATQAKIRPPTFIFFTSRPEDLPTSYVRFLENSLRTTFGLPGTPIRMITRKGHNPYAKSPRR